MASEKCGILLVLAAVALVRGTTGSNGISHYQSRPQSRSSTVPLTQNVATPQRSNSDSHFGSNELAKTQETIVEQAAGVYGGYGSTQTGNPTAIIRPNAINGYNVPVIPSYASSQSPPIIGVSSNGDFALSAYFGPVFWGFVAGLCLSLIVIWVINIFSGFDYLRSSLTNIGDEKNGPGKGKSLEVNHLTSLVYAAMDKYNKWNSNSNVT